MVGKAALNGRAARGFEPLQTGCPDRACAPADATPIVLLMNRRQRARRESRRGDHTRARDVDRPALVLTRKSYPEVKSAHIVPRMYQRAFAVDDRVAVHIDGRPVCVLMSTRNAGTRPRYYRRMRPDGQHIDDVEASLSYVEDKAAEPLATLIAGDPMTHECKGAVAQLLAVQMMRGPAFFQQREELLRPVLEGLARTLASVDDDVEEARRRSIDQEFGATQRFMSMLTRAPKMATILGHMRWQILRFDGPMLAYSDHPVVLWPMDIRRAAPFGRQGLEPLSALEIRVPIAPDAAILMTWADRRDETHVPLGLHATGELNAFTVGQADRQWMHQPGSEPEVPTGSFAPISRLVEPTYDREAMLRSARHARAQGYVARVKNREHAQAVEVLLDVGPEPRRQAD